MFTENVLINALIESDFFSPKQVIVPGDSVGIARYHISGTNIGMLCIVLLAAWSCSREEVLLISLPEHTTHVGNHDFSYFAQKSQTECVYYFIRSGSR